MGKRRSHTDLVHKLAMSASFLLHSLQQYVRRWLPFPIAKGEGGLSSLSSVHLTSSSSDHVESGGSGAAFAPDDAVLYNRSVSISPQYKRLADAVRSAILQQKLLVVYYHSELSPQAVRLLRAIEEKSHQPNQVDPFGDVIFYLVSMLGDEAKEMPILETLPVPSLVVWAPSEPLDLMATLEAPPTVDCVCDAVTICCQRWALS